MINIIEKELPTALETETTGFLGSTNTGRRNSVEFISKHVRETKVIYESEKLKMVK